jgi:hypothetical protein
MLTITPFRCGLLPLYTSISIYIEALVESSRERSLLRQAVGLRFDYAAVYIKGEI